MAALDAESLSPMDGMVGSMPDADAVPGLTAERPISASALTTLWRCPYRFFLERLLGFREPAQRPATDHIDPLAYGSLFHTVAEVFFREVGEAICTRRGDLPKWIDRARAIASVEFDRLQDEYPLRGGEAIERERSACCARSNSWCGTNGRSTPGRSLPPSCPLASRNRCASTCREDHCSSAGPSTALIGMAASSRFAISILGG